VGETVNEETLTEAEKNYEGNEKLVQQVEDNRAHPERRLPRPERARR
jgi:hypothetical protein